jgi:hypothetical protein
MQAYAKNYNNLNLKFSKNKICHRQWTTHWDIVTSMFFKPLRQHFDITCFLLSKSLYSRSILFERTNNCLSLLTNRWDCRIPNFRCRSACIFTFIICHITLTFPSTLKTFPIYVTVAMLSRC